MAGNEKLVLNQYDTLAKADAVKNADRLDPAIVRNLFDVTVTVCDEGSYAGGISLNEIPESYLAKHGVPPELRYSRVILLRPNINRPNLGTVLQDTLVINPHIVVPNNTEFYPHLEGCGSIRQGNIFAFISRPYEFSLYGYVWRPEDKNRPPKKTKIPSGYFFGDMTIHEEEHTKGFCYIQFPWRFKNIGKGISWKQIRDTYPNYTSKQFKDILKSIGKPFLVWADDKYIVVDHNGKYLQDFEFQPQISLVLNQLDSSQYNVMSQIRL